MDSKSVRDVEGACMFCCVLCGLVACARAHMRACTHTHTYNHTHIKGPTQTENGIGKSFCTHPNARTQALSVALNLTETPVTTSTTADNDIGRPSGKAQDAAPTDEPPNSEHGRELLARAVKILAAGYPTQWDSRKNHESGE